MTKLETIEGGRQADAKPGYFQDLERRFDARTLGSELAREGNLLTSPDGTLWRYEGGVFHADGERWVNLRVAEALGGSWKRHYANEVVAWLKCQERTLNPLPTETRLLNVRNGMLNLETEELHPHGPEHRSVVQIPHDWYPEAECPRILAFLADVLSEESISTVLELAGYLLVPGNPYQKAIMLHGPGGNGKSQLLELLTGLVGLANVAAVPLQAFSENRFASADLYGKLANICGDLDARGIARTDTFKQLVGGDLVRAERKFGASFTFINQAVPVFSANAIPMARDSSDAWYDRWLIVKMDRRFRDTDREVPDLGKQLASEPNEMQGLLVEAVKGVARLRSRRRFAVTERSREALEEYRRDSNPVALFLDEETIPEEGGFIPRPQLWQRWQAWSDASNQGGRLGRNTFYHRVEATGLVTTFTRPGGHRGFVGRRLA